MEIAAQPYTDYLVLVSITFEFQNKTYTSADQTKDSTRTKEAPASQVQQITSSQSQSSQIQLQWTQPAQPYGLISGYNVTWSLIDNQTSWLSSNDTGSLVTLDNNTLTAVIPANGFLTSCRNFSVQISALNGAGLGQPGYSFAFTSPNS